MDALRMLLEDDTLSPDEKQKARELLWLVPTGEAEERLHEIRHAIRAPADP